MKKLIAALALISIPAFATVSKLQLLQSQRAQAVAQKELQEVSCEGQALSAQARIEAIDAQIAKAQPSPVPSP